MSTYSLLSCRVRHFASPMSRTKDTCETVIQQPVPMTMSSGLPFHFPESTAIPSSSKARCSSPSPLPDESRVKYEMRTPLLEAYEAPWDAPVGEHFGTADTLTRSCVNRSLISSSSPFRPHRPHTLQPPTIRPSPQAAALYPHQFIQPTHHPQQNVLPLLNPSLPNDFLETAGQHGTSRPPQHSTPSCASSPQHVSINSSSWTSSHPVFTTTSALAAHHGIPQSLPPVPRTTRYPTENQQPVPSSSSNSPSEFDSLVSNYLNMLSQKPADLHSGSSVAHSDENAAALQAVLEVIQGTGLVASGAMSCSDLFALSTAASPEFQQIQEFGFGSSEMPGDYDSFLTSPMEESPFEDMLITPALGSGDLDYLTSPAIVDADDFGGFAPDAPLFGDSASFSLGAVEPQKSVPVPAVQHPADFDGLYTMSPDTPALDPSSLQTSPLATPVSPALHFPEAASRRKNAPTGTRKNITPEALVPYDAPIQARKYVTPSSTSRKVVPAAFAKKRARSQAFDDEEGEDDASLNPGDLDAIEAKRKQNTLAARRSRKRKLEYQRELESNVERMTDEVRAWKQRSEALEAIIRSHGIEVPHIPF